MNKTPSHSIPESRQASDPQRISPRLRAFEKKYLTAIFLKNNEEESALHGVCAEARKATGVERYRPRSIKRSDDWFRLVGHSVRALMAVYQRTRVEEVRWAMPPVLVP